MKAWLQIIKCWVRKHLTLRLRLALWSAALLLVVSLALVVFINAVASMAIPRYIAVPLLAAPPSPRPRQPGQPTPVPFEVPLVGPNTVAKGITVRQVRQATLQQVRVVSAIAVTWAIVLGSAGAYWLAGRALRPVQDLTQTTSRISANELDRRIDLEGPSDEIKALADAFNAMLGRLERAFEQKSHFVADAAHELCTPLATLRTNLEVVRAAPDVTLEDYREVGGALERALTRLEQLVADLLLLAQDETDMAMEEMVLGPLLEDVLLDLKPLAEEHQVSLDLSGETEIVVYGDGPLLASAFSNLIENGIRYNHPGGEVMINLRREGEGEWAVITVADTGIGISEEDQAHIFDRFYRADRSRSRHRGGAGLGLSIVAHVVQQHGGRVHLESTPGGGSTFTVRLPF